jgi:hypothetical protein
VVELGSDVAIDVCPQATHNIMTHGTHSLDHFRVNYMRLYAHLYTVRVFILTRVHPFIPRV